MKKGKKAKLVYVDIHYKNYPHNETSNKLMTRTHARKLILKLIRDNTEFTIWANNETDFNELGPINE